MRVLWTAVPALAALVATGLAATGFAASAAPISLAPHRVVYDLSLAKATGTRGVENARGRIAFDFLGDNCEGYALTYRQVTVLESGEVGSKTSDMRTATFEAGDGRSFRFRTDSEMEGAAGKKLDCATRSNASLQRHRRRALRGLLRTLPKGDSLFRFSFS